MTGVDVIVAALAAGTGAGVSDAAKGAVADAYGALRSLLRRSFSGRAQALQALDPPAAGEADVWRTRLGQELATAHADHDENILEAALYLLSLADPDGTRAGKYALGTVIHRTVTVAENSGVVAETVHGGVAINHGPSRQL